MEVGWHYLEDSDAGPPLGAAAFLDASEWGATRGHVVGGRARLRLCRPYWTGNPDAGEIADKAATWGARGCRVQAGNELNHPIERWQGGAAAFRAFFAQVRQRAPGVKLYWPGPSPGFPGWEGWLDGAEMADGIALHAYGTLQQMQAVTEYTARRFPGKALWVAECNFGAGQAVDVGRWAREHFAPFLDWCAGLGCVEAVTYFAYKWPTPDMALPVPVDGAGTEIEQVLRGWRAPKPKEEQMQPDYDGARVVESPHWNGRGGQAVTLIVVHATAGGTLDSVARWFASPKAGVSAHYIIGKDGEVVQCVREAERAWHAGDSLWRGKQDVNGFSAGIELVNANDGRDPYPAAQVAALVDLCADIAKRHPVRDIASHAEVAIPAGRKSDPLGLDMALVRRAVARATMGPTPSPAPAYSREQIGGAIWHIEELARQRRAAGDPTTHDVIAQVLLPALYPLRDDAA